MLVVISEQLGQRSELAACGVSPWIGLFTPALASSLDHGWRVSLDVT